MPGELGAEAPDRHDNAEYDQHDSREGQDDLAAVKRQYLGGVVACGGVTSSRRPAVHDEHQSAEEQDCIADAVNERPDPVSLGQVQSHHRGLDEPPHGQPQEPDDEDPQEQVSEGLGSDRLDRSSAVRRMLRDAEGDHNRDHPNDDVGDAASDETQAGEGVEGTGSPRSPGAVAIAVPPARIWPAVAGPAAVSLPVPLVSLPVPGISAPTSSQAKSSRHRSTSAFGHPPRPGAHGLLPPDRTHCPRPKQPNAEEAVTEIDQEALRRCKEEPRARAGAVPGTKKPAGPTGRDGLRPAREWSRIRAAAGAGRLRVSPPSTTRQRSTAGSRAGT